MGISDAIAGAVTAEFADVEDSPVFVTRAVVVFEGITAGGIRIMYSWRDPDTTMLWDAIGLLESQLARLKAEMATDDDE